MILKRITFMFALLLSVTLIFASCGTEYTVSDNEETVAVSTGGEKDVFEKIVKDETTKETTAPETTNPETTTPETTSAPNTTAPATASPAATAAPVAQAQDYTRAAEQFVLNTNTKKVHLPTCSSVKDIKPKNKQEVEATLDSLTAQGYSLCKRCLG